MPGARCTRSLAWENKNHTSKSTTVTAGIARHSPRNGFTASFVISSVSRALLPPSQAAMRKHCRPLDISVGISGPHDFAVRFSCTRLAPPPRPPHPAPNVRDDRETPLVRAQDVRESAGDLGKRSTAANWPDGASKNACDTLARRANQRSRCLAKKRDQLLALWNGSGAKFLPSPLVGEGGVDEVRAG